MARSAKEAIEQVVFANRILANEDVLDAFGHVSLRNRRTVTLFPVQIPVAPVRDKTGCPGDRLDGNVVTKTDKKPYGERLSTEPY